MHPLRHSITCLITNVSQRFETEIHVWDKLKHPHILSFYGIVTNLGPIHMVSPWQTFGNVLESVLSFRMCTLKVYAPIADTFKPIRAPTAFTW